MQRLSQLPKKHHSKNKVNLGKCVKGNHISCERRISFFNYFLKKLLNEIATSSNQKTVRFLAMTDLDRYFYHHLVLRKQHEGLSWKYRNDYYKECIYSNHNCILGFHPHPHLLPSMEKEFWLVIARNEVTWQSHEFNLFYSSKIG